MDTRACISDNLFASPILKRFPKAYRHAEASFYPLILCSLFWSNLKSFAFRFFLTFRIESYSACYTQRHGFLQWIVQLASSEVVEKLCYGSSQAGIIKWILLDRIIRTFDWMADEGWGRKSMLLCTWGKSNRLLVGGAGWALSMTEGRKRIDLKLYCAQHFNGLEETN